MICTECGKKINANAQFCNFCGARAAVKIPCPACGKLIPNNAKFCSYCGGDSPARNIMGNIPVLQAPAMKKHMLQCENCGSSTVIKKDGVFVCQSCGSGYSFESTQHITIQNTININDSNKNKKNDEYSNFVQVADDAFYDGLYTNAASYYAKALAIDPNSPCLIIRHGLSVLAKERITTKIPLTAVNSIERAIERLKKLDCSEEEFFNTIISCHNDIKNICNLYLEFLENEISAAKSMVQKIRSEGSGKKNGLSRTDINKINNLNAKIKGAQEGANLIIRYREEGTKKIINTLTYLSDECLINYLIHYIEERNVGLANVILEKKIQKDPNTPIGWFCKALFGLWKDKIDPKELCTNLRHMILAYQQNAKELDSNIKFIKKYVNSVDDKNNTLIHHSVQQCDYESTNFLIFLGINVNQLNKNKETPLWYSASKKWKGVDLEVQINIAKILLENGAEVDIKNKFKIALYNKNTCEKIETLILNYYPNALKGKSNIIF